jgi:hypothetical protein
MENLRSHLCTLVLCLFAGFLNTPAVAQITAIRHARVVDGSGSSATGDRTILIERRIIKAVGGPDLKLPSGAHVIDAKGRTAMPGLSDMHVHLAGGWDGETTDLLGYQNYMNSLLYSGVTTVLDTGNVPPYVLQLRQAVASGMVQGPRLYCVGPILDGVDPVWGPIAVAIGSKYQVPPIMERLKAENVDLVKLYIGLSDQLVRAISAEANKKKLRTIIDQGERNGSVDLMDSGIAGFAHLPRHRISEDAVRHARETGMFFISTLSVHEVFTGRRLRDLRFLDDPLISDVVPPSQLKSLRDFAQQPIPPDQQEKLRQALVDFQDAEGNVKRLWDSGVLIATGTDAPYPGDFQGEGVHHEMELLVESGLTPIQAITAATKNAAAIMNADKEWGTLEAGKLANILLIDGKPDQNINDTRRITFVMKQGEVIDREKLKLGSASKDFPVIASVSTQ